MLILSRCHSGGYSDSSSIHERSDYFSQRLMILPWLGAIAAAGGYATPQRLCAVLPSLLLS